MGCKKEIFCESKKRLLTALIFSALLLTSFSMVFVDIVEAQPDDNVLMVVPSTLDVTVGDDFHTWINVSVNWEIDNVTISNITFLPPGIVSYGSASQGNLFVGGNWWSPESTGIVNNASGYAFNLSWINTTGVNLTTSTIADITWHATNVGVADINLTGTTRNNSGINHGTTVQNATVRVHPRCPIGFNATHFNATQINLSWTMDFGIDKVIIERNTIPSWEMGMGEEIYNGTGTQYVDIDNITGKKYYYQAWGWNATAKLYSLQSVITSSVNIIISGRVRDRLTNTSLPGLVRIYLEGGEGLFQNEFETGPDGYFSVDVTIIGGGPGRYCVEVQREGYVGYINWGLELDEGMSIYLDILLDSFFDESNYSYVRGFVENVEGEKLKDAKVILLDKDFNHMIEEFNEISTDENGGFCFNITYRSTYILIAFYEGYYVNFSDDIVINNPSETYWCNHTLEIAEPDVLEMTVEFTDLDDAIVSVNRTVVAASPIFRFFLDFNPDFGNSNKIVDENEVKSYLHMIGRFGPIVNVFYELDDPQEDEMHYPDFLATPVSILLDESDLDYYLPGSFNGTLDNIIGTNTTSNETVYYNATFNITLDGLILNHTLHPLNITMEYNTLIMSNITFIFNSLYNITTIENTTNVSISSTLNTLTVSPGNGSLDEFALVNVSLVLNGTVVKLPIIEVPTWRISDRWVFNRTANGSISERIYTVEGKPLRPWEEDMFRVGDENVSYLSYEIRREDRFNGNFTESFEFATINNLDWVKHGEHAFVNDIDFPLYNEKSWFTKSWWGDDVNAVVVDCSEIKETSYGNFSCVKINYTNPVNISDVFAQQWYSQEVKFIVNRTKYLGNLTFLDLTFYSHAPYIESLDIYERDPNNNSLFDALDVNVTINTSGLAITSNYVMEGPFYAETYELGPPVEISWLREEEGLRNLNNSVDSKNITLSISGSLINASRADGPYRGWLELREFDEWGMGRAIDYREYKTKPYNHTDFEPPAVVILNLSDYGNDTDSNGLYNFLTLNVTLRVMETGNYTIHGGLDFVLHGFWDEWMWITGTGTEVLHLVQGTTPTIQLNFDGSEIYERGFSGRFKVHIDIWNEDVNAPVARNESDTMYYYHYDHFERPLVYFNDTWMSESGMHDYVNGSMYLTINASVIVKEGAFGGGAQVYEIHGGIHYTIPGSDEPGEFITGSGNEITLYEGENIVPLNFNTVEIYRRNTSYNGTFKVYMGLSEKVGDWIGPEVDWSEYVTRGYNVSDPDDFPPPPITMEIFNDSITGGGDYLTIRAYVNITSDSFSKYGDRWYDLHGAVHCNESGWWVFVTGKGEQVYLDDLTNIVSLNFSGMEIAAYGVDGPYDIWMGLDDPATYEMIVGAKYLTSYYSVGEFIAPGAVFDERNITHRMLDFLNGTDYLTVELPIIVNDLGSYHIGGGIHWIIRWGDWEEWMFITGYGVDLVDIPPGRYNVSLNFEQGMIRDALPDDYCDILAVHAGIEDIATWQHLTHTVYETKVYNYSDFSPAGVTIEGNVTGINDDGNLYVNLTLNVSKPDNYDVHGGVHWVDYSPGWENWRFITGAWEGNVPLAGQTYINLTFNGREIYNSMQDGPYMIWIGIENMSTRRLVAYTEIETLPYNYTDFAAAAPTVRIMKENMPHASVDYMNTSGSVAYLTVNVSLNESGSGGTYWLDGGIHYRENDNWEPITGTGDIVTLSQGENIVPLNFNAGDIYSSGRDGPYMVRIAIRNITTWLDIDHYEYLTKNYSSGDAPPPPIQFGNMPEGQCDYLNSSYITINVTLNVSDASYAGIYDVHGGINYLDPNDWWYHLTSTGTWVELTNGTNNVSLNFNADEIKMGLPDGYNDTLVAWIGLSDTVTWREITHIEYITGVYNKNDLPGPRIMVEATGDCVDGPYFNISLDINVSAGNAGTYEIHGGLHWIDTTSFGWEDWRFITGTGTQQDLTEGVNNVNLSFNSGEIYNVLSEVGYNGKLAAWIGIEDPSISDHVAHTEYITMNNYSSASFDPPTLIIQCTGDYNDNGVNLVVNVTVNATGNSLNKIYKIHGGIHWRDEWEWRFITGAEIVVNVTHNMTVPLNFSGGMIRSCEHNGPYEVWVGISLEDELEDITHAKYLTSGYSYLDFAPPAIRILENCTDYLNGTQYLTINVSIDANQTGIYFLEGSLHYQVGHHWEWIAWAGKEINITSTGLQSIPLNFDGREIALAGEHGWTGGPLVAWLAVWDSTWNEISHLEEYVTGIYYPGDFSASPVTFDGSITDKGFNDTGIGKPYTQLNVTIPINVTTSGNYTVFAALFDATNNTLIVTSWNEINCSMDNVTLIFNGSKINRRRYNGTFEFKAKIFENETWFICDTLINSTHYYNYTDFVEGTLEATIVGNYSNFTDANGNLVVNVTINIAQNHTLFELYGDLFDDTATTYITNAKNVSYHRNQTGDVVVPLVFNGSAIDNSSVDKPYRLAYLRLSVFNQEEEIWEEIEVKIDPYINIYPGGA